MEEIIGSIYYLFFFSSPVVFSFFFLSLGTYFYIWKKKIPSNHLQFTYKSVIEKDEYYRIYSCLFYHNDLSHLSLNTLSLIGLSVLEEKVGSWLLFIYFLAVPIVIKLFVSFLYNFVYSKYYRAEWILEIPVMGLSSLLLAFITTQALLYSKEYYHGVEDEEIDQNEVSNIDVVSGGTDRDKYTDDLSSALSATGFAGLVNHLANNLSSSNTTSGALGTEMEAAIVYIDRNSSSSSPSYFSSSSINSNSSLSSSGVLFNTTEGSGSFNIDLNSNSSVDGQVARGDNSGYNSGLGFLPGQTGRSSGRIMFDDDRYTSSSYDQYNEYEKIILLFGFLQIPAFLAPAFFLASTHLIVWKSNLVDNFSAIFTGILVAGGAFNFLQNIYWCGCFLFWVISISLYSLKNYHVGNFLISFLPRWYRRMGGQYIQVTGNENDFHNNADEENQLELGISNSNSSSNTDDIGNNNNNSNNNNDTLNWNRDRDRNDGIELRSLNSR